MPTPEKEALVAQLHQDIEDHPSIYLAEFRGLSVRDMNDLRGRILQAQGRLQVAKNRLLKLALQDTDAQQLTQYLDGPTAIAFCGDDPIAVAKAFASFAQEHEHVAIKAGVVEGRVVDRQQAARIASLPPRLQLLAQALAGLIAPATGLVCLLGAAALSLVLTLQAIADERQQEEGSG